MSMQLSPNTCKQSHSMFSADRKLCECDDCDIRTARQEESLCSGLAILSAVIAALTGCLLFTAMSGSK